MTLGYFYHKENGNNQDIILRFFKNLHCSILLLFVFTRVSPTGFLQSDLAAKLKIDEF